MSEAQARAAEARVAGLAQAEGLGFDPERPVGNTFDLHRVIHLGREKGVQRELLTARQPGLLRRRHGRSSTAT